jgi:uncharacterized protein (UPF0264 family)
MTMAANKHPHPGPGRPRLWAAGQKTKTISVPVSDALYDRIQLHAQTRDRSIASLVREIVMASELAMENPTGVSRGAAGAQRVSALAPASVGPVADRRIPIKRVTMLPVAGQP